LPPAGFQQEYTPQSGSLLSLLLCAKSPELPDLDSVNLAIASHPLQRFWVNTEQLCSFIAVQKRLESKFISW
jgi:hypothetical protein